MSDAAPPRAFRRRGLGRGLDALLTNEAEAEEGSPLISLDPRTVAPEPRTAATRVRTRCARGARRFDPPARPAPSDRRSARWAIPTCLVAGERRLRAAQLAGVVEHPGDRPPRCGVRAATSSRWRSPRTCCEPISTRWRRPPPMPASRTPSASPTRRSRSAWGAAGPAISNAIRLLDLPAPVQEAVAELAADREPRAGAPGAAACGGSGGRGGPRDRRRPERARDRARGPGTAHTGIGGAAGVRRPPQRSRPPPTMSRCVAASSRRSAFPSASSAARAAAAGSSSTGPRNPTWTRSIASSAARRSRGALGGLSRPAGPLLR